jgi:hypothetical protein
MAKDMDAVKAMFRTGEYVGFPLRDVLLNWAGHLATPDTKFDAVGKYKVNCVLSNDIAEEMMEVGFNVKKDEDGQHYVVPTRKPDLGAPRVVDTDGNDIDPNTVGNGSIATVDVKTKFMVINKKEHQPLYIEKVTITDLVSYDGGGSSVDPF